MACPRMDSSELISASRSLSNTWMNSSTFLLSQEVNSSLTHEEGVQLLTSQAAGFRIQTTFSVLESGSQILNSYNLEGPLEQFILRNGKGQKKTVLRSWSRWSRNYLEEPEPEP